MTIEEAKELLGSIGWSTREMSEYSDGELLQYAEEEEAYARHMREQDLLCNASIEMGPRNDLYGSSCELEKGHYPETDHKGPHPIAENTTITWRGGGYCAGDPLPMHITSSTENTEGN
jgi:hypothetical protein